MNRDEAENMELMPISEQASRWWVVLRGEDVSAADHREFADWVARSPERIKVWIETEQLMRALKSSEVRWPDTPSEVLIREAKAMPAEVPISLASLASRPEPAFTKRAAKDAGVLFKTRSKVGMAAALVVAIVSGWVYFTSPPRYQTALGEQRSVVLDDGSVVTLNTASKIAVDLRKDRRVIELLSGEALFQVAHEKSRPFEVIAGDTTVRAVGTQFNVDRRPTNTTVTVVEGKVAVLRPRASNAVSDEQPVFLAAAERAVITPSSVSSPERVANVAAATAWTQRRLIFERRPLGEVAAEFNRYNRQTIKIDSTELRNQEVTGVFLANDPDSFVAFLSEIPGVAVRKNEDGINVVAAQAAEVR